MNSETSGSDNQRIKREQLRRQEIHLSILQAAEKIIISKGFSAMNMDDVASEACLSKATVYKYIPGKNRILFEIACRYLDDWQDKVDRITASEGSCTEKLRVIVVEMLNFHRRKQNISRILILDESTQKILRQIYQGEGRSDCGQMQKDIAFLKRKSQGITQKVVQIVQEGIDGGEFRLVDAQETVFFITSFLVGIDHTSFWLKTVSHQPTNELAAKISDFILSYLRKPDPAASIRSAGTNSNNTPPGEIQE